jgi:Arc/MetJ family transcription regulator
MRTNIEIDDSLMARTMQATGAKTKRAAVETAMMRLLAIEGQKGMLELRGRIHWEGHDERPDKRVPDEAWGR